MLVRDISLVSVSMAMLLVISASGEDCPPLRVTGLPPVVCASAVALNLELENRGASDVLVSVRLERLREGGEWEEHCPDVLHKSTTKQLLAVAIGSQEKRPVTWRPRETCDFLPFSPGLYRLVATVTDRTAGRKWASTVAYFEVMAEPCCTSGTAGIGSHFQPQQ